ncbi:thioesterase [Teratosphaeria destructans]|uniref:Thioesterase n=1 Tax=Teratosphaeria destructans TaxID=418781 RepID=A0A9W7VY40_9PEZI|nr:thioesterase [Teratosphaeria destructans]
MNGTGLGIDAEGRGLPIRAHRERFVQNPITRSKRSEFYRALKFQVPNPQDAVYWQTKLILEQYNKKSPRHESDPLQIEALNVAPTLCVEPYETVPVVHCLVRNELFIKLQLKMVCDVEHGWATSTVMVRDDDRWITLEQLLQGLPDPTMPACTKVFHEAQLRSWRGNGKAFPFTHLAPELQKKILLFAIGEHIEPIYTTRLDPSGTWWRPFLHLTGGTPRDHFVPKNDKTRLARLRPVNAALFQINRATRRLALEVLWTDTTKRYSTQHPRENLGIVWQGHPAPPTVSPTLSFLQPQSLKYMRHIQLDLPNLAYATMFGCPMPPVLDEEPSTLGPALRALPNLRSLELHFRSTTDSTYSPWIAVQYDASWQVEDLQETYPDFEWNRLPCQKVLHDWILLWAAEYLLGIPQVCLTGYIKTQIRKKWEAVIRCRVDERAKMLAWIEEEKESVRALPLGAL